MACLRGQTDQERVGVVFCDEEGCELRRVTDCIGSFFDEYPPEADCVLQLRLRAGIAEIIGGELTPQQKFWVEHAHCGAFAVIQTRKGPVLTCKDHWKE